jgi:hypothetical protein
MKRLCALALLMAASAAAQQVLVDDGATARYLPVSADPGIAMTWTAETFDDSSWSAGRYGIGYEDATGAAALLRTLVPSQTRSVFTRTTFDVADPSAIASLAMGADYDDAVAAWLNGVEIWRSPEMPLGALAWDTDPDLHESSNATSPVFTPYADVSAAALPALHAGTNVLAVAVWNGSLPSSDLVLVPQLVANSPPTLARGPYLQLATPDSIVIRWRTLSPSDTVVRWGPAPGSLTSSLVDAAPRRDHEARLTGLQPATTYFYSVGLTGTTLAGDDAVHRFTTPPVPGTRAPLHAWVVGDSGTGDANARRVRDAWRTHEGGRAPDFWLMLGDNAYDSGTDGQYQRAVFDTYSVQLAQSVDWPTFGNHDALSATSTTQSGAYYDAFTLPANAEAGGVASGTEAYWSFDWANVHFVCLDSQDTDRSPTGAMADWLRRDLAATTQEWVVAFFHHPPYSKGNHDSDVEIRHVEMRENILPILEDFGVDLILSGHSHSYERSFLVDREYGLSTTQTPANVIDGGDGRESGDGAYTKPQPGLTPHSGEVCVVAGSSGKLETGGTLDHPVMVVSLSVLGSLVLDVAGDRLDAAFVDDAGAVRDNFTIVKQRPPPAEDCVNGSDDDGDTLIDCADPDCSGLDDDADGLPDCVDCAPLDASAFAIPPEIAMLRITKPSAATALLAWDDVRPLGGTSTVADVATGAIRELWADRGFARAACLARDLPIDAMTDTRAAPAMSDGWWYLVRARSACGASAWSSTALSLAGCP